MNAIEIEEAVSELVERPFDAGEFAFQFLEAFGNKPTTIKRLRDGTSNASDIGGVLQRNNIHIAVAEPGTVTARLEALRASPGTAKAKAKFILATDGETLEAEDIEAGKTLACAYTDLPNHFGFFLQLAGFKYTQELAETKIDRGAARHLNRLYVQLLHDNNDWNWADRQADMNHFMAQLIFCFYAEDTGIFNRGTPGFTETISKMSSPDGSDTHEVILEIFRAMNVPTMHEGKPDSRYRQAAGTKPFANRFPYVNGGLFGGGLAVPKFSRIARSYLLRIGNLDWTQINPDIFGSMIQAITDEKERGALGVHYTSRPNILKVLKPLFLDSLHEQLEEAGDNPRKLLNLRNRMARIRVFDPACGSGNFLVIAYKEMREIEAEINRRRDETDRPSALPLTNFRGIELREFPAEIARLALIIAEFQCDTLYRGQKLALAEFLPLNKDNWITCDNALRLDWSSVCPQSGTGVAIKSIDDDLFSSPLKQPEIDFENEGGENYICGNPPYIGQSEMTDREKADLAIVFEKSPVPWKSLDYVLGWFKKAIEYCSNGKSSAAFVATNSICQGQQVPSFWQFALQSGVKIHFARTSFKWKNLAKNNAGVIVVVVGITFDQQKPRLFIEDDKGDPFERSVGYIGPYLVPDNDTIVHKSAKPLNGLSQMDYGSKPADGGGLILSTGDLLALSELGARKFIKPYLGSDEFIDGKLRHCLWINPEDLDEAMMYDFVRSRVDIVRRFRANSTKPQTRAQARTAHSFAEVRHGKTSRENLPLIVPIHTSESRSALPVGALTPGAVVSNAAFGLYNAPLWNMALIASRLHLVWIATVCGKIKTDFRYSNTLGWNTFPVPTLTDKNKADLTRCAEDILLAREAHFPATIADLYDPETMPANLREAHERNDEVLERIYIGRRFKNDTERLEKLFELYTKMTANVAPAKKRKAGAT